jgi:hypothetical protein
MELLSSAGNQFMGVSLVPYVPDNYIIGCIKDVMQGQSQFHCPEVRSQVPAVLRYSAHNLVPDLLGQSIELFDRQNLQILRAVNTREKGFFLLL